MAVQEDIGREAKRLKNAAAAGLRSGYNDLKAGGWGGLFGMGHLRNIRGIQQNHQASMMGLIEKNGGFDGLRGLSQAQVNTFREEASAMGKSALGKMGGEALGFMTGAGYKGVARAGAIGARAALMYGAIQAADFLNPFGFGSIDD